MTMEDEGTPVCRLHMASANSNHCPVAIMHTIRSTIKYNLAIKIGELTNRHKAYRETWHIGNRGNREGADREVANGGDRK